MATRNYNILACDGGGFRGVMTATLIADLNNSFPGILDKIDLFAGTSTGGIISMGLASQLMTPESLINFYETQGPTVFQRYKPPAGGDPDIEKGSIGAKLVEMGLCTFLPDLCYVRYTNVGQIDALTPFFGEHQLGEINRTAMVNTCVLSDQNDDPWTPITLDNLPGSTFLNVKLLDAVMCTSSPPVFLPPYLLPTNPQRWCVDGAVFANNPSMQAISKVISTGVLDSEGKKFSDVRMLSLGTGLTGDATPFSYIKEPFGWGVINWMHPLPLPPQPALPLINLFMEGPSKVADSQAGAILGSDHYRRANPPLQGFVEIDDWQSVPDMEQWTQDYMTQPEWQSTKQWVATNFV